MMMKSGKNKTSIMMAYGFNIFNPFKACVHELREEMFWGVMGGAYLILIYWISDLGSQKSLTLGLSTFLL